MPVLCFPSPDTLRLVLAGQVVPPAVTDAPARVGCDDHGRFWVEPAVPPPRETLAALARLGVRSHTTSPAPLAAAACWAAGLPLRPAASDPPAGTTTLYEHPTEGLVRFVSAFCRRGRQPGVRLQQCGRAWVLVPSPCPPPDACDGTVDTFREQSPGVWVLTRWEHPVPERLVVPTARTLVLRPGRPPEVAEHGLPVGGPVEWGLSRQPAARGVPSPHRLIGVDLRLRRESASARESLWVFDGTRAHEFREFCAEADERLVRRFEVATVRTEEGSRLLVRGAGGRKTPPPLPFPGCGFAADARVPGLYTPAGHALRPEVRTRELAHVLGAGAGHVSWVEPGDDGRPVPHVAPAAALRPLTGAITYTVPPPRALEDAAGGSDPFAFDRFVLCEDGSPPAVSEPVPAVEPGVVGPDTPDDAEPPGWLSRSLGRLTARLRRPREDQTEPDAAPACDSTPPRRPRPTARVDQSLSSADALLHGPDRTARRHELEGRLLAEFPSLSPDRRAVRWAELAGVYGATGNPTDAAVCWINAVWEADAPPPAWLEHWLHAECRAAKLNEPTVNLERILGEPGRFGMGRVLAAFVTWGATRPALPAGLAAAAPRVLAFLDQHFDDLPARAAWLARAALARVSAGDTLGLAKWRDRVLARLRDRGPGLDLDEPSFLRFHGTASPDRFRTAREWLARARGPILGWVGSQGTPGRLQFAGLDPETECTSAYAQFLLAWGLACLGERARSRDWAARARKVLTRAAGPGVDPAVHALLADALGARVRDAQEGRPAKAGLPPELQVRLDLLPDFSRYAVDKFRRHVGVLEPTDRVREYRGKEFREFWGPDLLGERLSVLADRTDPAYLNDEARQLLAACEAEPSWEVVPRVAFTLLEVAAHLDPPLVPRLLAEVPAALDGLEAWLAAGRWTAAERAARLPRFHARLLENAFTAAASGGRPAVVRPLVEDLLGRAAADPSLRTAIGRAAGPVFRALRKLGHRAEGEALLQILDPVRGGSPESRVSPAGLGLAVGWFAAGDEDAGTLVLDAARDRLFLAGPGDDRERTELALAYAAALGFAPARIALGRLEEVFQRLGRVAVTGSTNRYFTLKPLQLVDTVVRAVVTEDFALGPAVRGWLDDDEFLIRRRVHRDMADVLRDAGLG